MSVIAVIDAQTGAVVEVPAPPAPEEPAPDPGAELAAWRAGAVVSRFQARAALMDAGLLAQVELAIAEAAPIVQLAWAEVVEFRRASPLIDEIGAALDLSPAQIDDLFRAAAEISI